MWRSIQDEQPDNDQECLVADIDASGSVSIMRYNAHTKSFYEDGWHVMLKYTHWMPIPTAPVSD